MTALSVKLCGREATPWDEVRISLCFLTVVLRFSIAAMNVEGSLDQHDVGPTGRTT